MSEEMKALREQLLRDTRGGYDVLTEAQLAEMERYCTDYKAFLANKTERLSALAAIAVAEWPVHSAAPGGSSSAAGPSPCRAAASGPLRKPRPCGPGRRTLALC